MLEGGMNLTSLGEARFDSPLQRVVSGQARIPAQIVSDPTAPAPPELWFELAGPRAKLFFDPPQTRAAIVTCGGLSPGMNNVIRSLFLQLHHCYGVKEVLGFRGGYQGLDPARGGQPLVLNSELVDDIHREGGTMLGTSRGPVNVAAAVENLLRREVDILFTIGGDGTHRGGHELFDEARRRGHPLSVIGVPKTIDNDIPYVSRTFGYLTAIEEAAKVLDCAHTECHSVHNGISLVKLMGREAGFIAAGATIASQDVNFTLIPEVPFQLDGPGGFLAALKKRVLKRRHAVIVVAEGAGQDLLESGEERDASGNLKLKDIGGFLRQHLEGSFKSENIPFSLRYFDPSYLIRSVPADAEDAILCDLYARNAVHAAMAGRTGVLIGLLHDKFILVPVELLAGKRKRLDPNGLLWHSVLSATGQPAQFE
jgi:6-phosphofructokinase 1